MQLLTNALIPFTSTFAGVFLAFLLGVWWQRHQRTQEERKLRLETKVSLAEELEGIRGEVQQILEAWKVDKDTIPIIDFCTDAKESSVSSGRFTLLELNLQTEVGHIYAVIQQATDYRTRLLPPRLAMMPSPYPRLLEEFEGRLHHLEERIPPLIKDLELA